MKRLITSTASAIALLVATPAVSEDTYILDNVGNWEIGLDADTAGCFAFGRYDNGTFLKFGYNAVDATLEFIIGSDHWNSLEHGMPYDLSVKFGGNRAWLVPSIGGKMGQGLDFLSSITSDPAVIRQFMKARQMYVSYQGREIAVLSLEGSYRAFKAVQQCQVAVLDKLSHGARRADDPFRDRSRSGRSNTGREYRISDPFSR